MKYQSKMGSSPRPISTRLLNDSRHLHIVPINLVVFKGSYLIISVGYLIYNGFKKGMEDEDAEQSEETVKKADKKDEDEE